MLHLTFFMMPNIVFAPNIRRTQNTDTGRKTQTQLITGFVKMAFLFVNASEIRINQWLKWMFNAFKAFNHVASLSIM